MFVYPVRNLAGWSVVRQLGGQTRVFSGEKLAFGDVMAVDTRRASSESCKG